MKRIVLAAICCFPLLADSQPEMLFVKGGSFLLGDTSGDADERPIHAIQLNDFFIAKTETTVAQFKVFVEMTAYRTDAERAEGSYIWDSLGWHKREGVNWRHTEIGRLRPAEQGNYPVVHVSWNDAAYYCNWLSEQSGLQKVYDFQNDSLHISLTANGFRLPTEAEWEYAAAGGKTVKSERYAGADEPGAVAWYSGNASRRPHAAGQKRPNTLGIYDFSGNVWEWCQDWYDKDFYATSVNAQNPSGPESGETRCLRGGSWNNSGKHLRIANRSSRYPDFRDGSVGFRVARRK
ncbi:MAG TPA: formylglycine-generating enzyme family protein [Saprospiraceae bacterium]|nr:formylglycine-generating enzyme family protein [Saprospiraceae bacterium]